ncbi:hypothetical protein AgCh_000600 [Apium graveolens]
MEVSPLPANPQMKNSSRTQEVRKMSGKRKQFEPLIDGCFDVYNKNGRSKHLKLHLLEKKIVSCDAVEISGTSFLFTFTRSIF